MIKYLVIGGNAEQSRQCAIRQEYRSYEWRHVYGPSCLLRHAEDPVKPAVILTGTYYGRMDAFELDKVIKAHKFTAIKEPNYFPIPKDVLAAMEELLADYDEESQSIHIRQDAGCPQCTANTVPYRLTRGLCPMHTIQAFLERLRKQS